MAEAKTQYLCNVGIDYMAGKEPKRAEAGDVIDDLPTSAVEELLEQGVITDDLDAEPASPYTVYYAPTTEEDLGDPTAGLAEVERVEESEPAESPAEEEE